MVHSIAPLACILFWLGTEVLYCGVCLSRLERLGWDPAFSVPSCYHRWVFEPGFLCSVRSLSLGLESSEPVYKRLTVTLGVWLQVLPQVQTVMEKREIAAKWPCIGSNHATRRECAKGGVLQGLLGKASTGSRGAMLPTRASDSHGPGFSVVADDSEEVLCVQQRKYVCESVPACVCVCGGVCACVYVCIHVWLRMWEYTIRQLRPLKIIFCVFRL